MSQALASVSVANIVPLDQIGPADVGIVGGKGLSLGLMAKAGLPVPPGFCVTTAAYRRVQGRPIAANDELAAQIADAYDRLGRGPVAVRSSAPAEDCADASFAGQHETLLAVRGAEAVIAAVSRCWASLASERSVAYRRRQGDPDADPTMAVVVQRLVPGVVSGVLFTCDPLDASGQRMLVEAAWGLGDNVVAGRMTPDRFQLDRETGRVLDRQIGFKPAMSTAEGEQEVEPDRQTQPCLDDGRLAELAELGRRVEMLFGDARDVEWAWADGRFWLLQARPITAAGAAERNAVRRAEIVALAARAEPGGTVWSRFNLAEILPEPTPMTWAIVRRFLSGRGGLGQMYRDVGFDPDPALDDDGIYDLVCGRPYCNLSREPRMLYRRLPFEHPFAALKANPARALYPQAVLNPARAGWRFWLLLPLITIRLVRSAARLRGLSRTFAHKFQEEILPSYLQALERDAAIDLEKQELEELRELLHRVIQLTLHDYARDSLKPTLLAALAMGSLERGLGRTLGKERTREAVGELMMGVQSEPEADLPRAIEDLAAGTLDRAAFVERFGHRGGQEMELSEPRWAEDLAAIDRLVVSVGQRRAVPPASIAPLWDRIAMEAKLTRNVRAALAADLQALHTYLRLRETAKHYLMKGYALIRRILLELDRRFQLNGGIFYLTPEELPELVGGANLLPPIRERRRRRALALTLEVPPVLFSDDLEAIGRPVSVTGADTMQGVPLSAGVAEGEALVLREPIGAAPPGRPYILVCPSTDPAWVPWFVGARGLVMETGGVLSHGAIVAREFGLPAVAGVPGVHRRIRTGQLLRVDGATGRVTILS